MAAVTTAAIGVAAAGYQIYDAEQKKKKANQQLNEYERQDLNNAFEDVKISTLGSDILREENQRTSTNLVDSLRQGGTRSILGGIPQIVAANNQANMQSAKMLDNQVIQREYSKAGDNARIEAITENRDIANISGLSSQIDAANQDMWSGFGSALSSAAYMGRGLKEMKGETLTEEEKKLETTRF